MLQKWGVSHNVDRTLKLDSRPETIFPTCEELGVSYVAFSPVWMLLKKPYIIPIPGSRKIERIESNFKASNIVLSEEEMNTIDALLKTIDFDVFGGHKGK